MGLEDFSREWTGILGWKKKFKEVEVVGEVRVPCVRAGEKVKVIILVDCLGDEIAREDWLNVEKFREIFYEFFRLGEAPSVQEIGFIQEKEVNLKVVRSANLKVEWKEDLVEYKEEVVEEEEREVIAEKVQEVNVEKGQEVMVETQWGDPEVDYELDDPDEELLEEAWNDQIDDNFGEVDEDPFVEYSTEEVMDDNGWQGMVNQDEEAYFSDEENSSRPFRDIVPEEKVLQKMGYVAHKSQRFMEREQDRRPWLYALDKQSKSSFNNSLCDDLGGSMARLKLVVSVEEEDYNISDEEEEEKASASTDSGSSEEEVEGDHGLGTYLGRMIEATMEAIMNFGDGVEDQDCDVLRVKVHDLCLEAMQYGDNQLGEKAAVTWADGFEVPNEVIAKDEGDWKDNSYNFEQFVRSRVAVTADGRLSEERVERCVRDSCKDKEVLKEMARVLEGGGMNLCLPPDYIPNSRTGLPPYSKSYQKTHSAVDRMIYENFYQKGLAIILSEALVNEKMGDFSVAVARWAVKAGKIWGRNIHDATAAIKNQIHVLNSKYSKVACKEKYGAIHCPTLQSIICMVFDFWEREFAIDPTLTWDDLVLWKMDLAGAFTLLYFGINMVRHVGLRLWGGLIVFFLCGVFGWTGTPGCFQVVNRVLMYEASFVLYGMAQMFVDDVMGVTLKKKLDSDLAIMWRIITDLLGEGAVADDKTESGRRVVILGFTLDLDAKLAAISHKNLVKALYSFMSVDEHGLVTFKQLETLASLGSRYGLICVHMNPMVRLLYKELHEHRWSARPVFKLANDTKVLYGSFGQCW